MGLVWTNSPQLQMFRYYLSWILLPQLLVFVVFLVKIQIIFCILQVIAYRECFCDPCLRWITNSNLTYYGRYIWIPKSYSAFAYMSEELAIWKSFVQRTEDLSPVLEIRYYDYTPPVDHEKFDKISNYFSMFIMYLGDETEIIGIYFPCKIKHCRLKNVIKRLNLFVDYHNSE